MTTTVQPPASAGPETRIVPALIDGTRVFIECPTWCTIDHVRENQKFLVDVWHSGEFADLEAPGPNGIPDLLAYARIGIDPFSSDETMRHPFLFVEDGSNAKGSYLDAENAEKFADTLVTFAEKIRAMGRVLKAVTV